MKFFLALSSLLLASAVNVNGECTAITNNQGVKDNDCNNCDVDTLQMFWPCDLDSRPCEGTCWFVGDPLPPHPPSYEIEGCVPIKQARLTSGSATNSGQCDKCADGQEGWPCDVDPPKCEGMECVGDVFDKVHAAEKDNAPPSALELALADVCKASAWGDPHMVTFDGVKFDAQPKGEATFLTSDEPRLVIQGRLEKANHGRGDPSVTTGIAIEGPGDSPVIQVSIAQPEFISVAGFGAKQDGYCVKSNNSDQNDGVQKLVGGDYNDVGDLHKQCLEMCAGVKGVTGCEMIWDQNNRGCYAHTANIDGGGNGVHRHSCYAVEVPGELGSCSGYQDITVGNVNCAVEMMVNGEKQDMIAYHDELAIVEQNGNLITIDYPGVVKVEMALGVFGRCLFSVNVFLYDCASYENSAIGLLGSPNNNSTDDWMDQDGNVLERPSGSSQMFFKPAFDYVKENWIINDPDDSIFTYDNCASFETLAVPDEEYDPELELLVDEADPEILAICGEDVQCIIDGETLGTDAAVEFIKNPAKDRVPVDLEELLLSDDPTASPTNGPTTSPTGSPSKATGLIKLEDDDSLVCTQDVQECSDGSFVSRDPDNQCAFPECPTIICTQEVQECSDGSFVSRDPDNSCEFPECPPVIVVDCMEDAKVCSDGSSVSRDPENFCEFKACPKGKGSGSGDPHFKTWTGDKYDYHGECDLVLVDHPAFSNDLGLKIHIRTSRVKYFSFISNIAVQIGDDVLEFDNDVENFMINGEMVPPQRKHVKTLLGGFHVRRDPKAISIRFDKHIKSKIDLIQRKNGWPAIIVDGAETEIFKGSLGLLGDWENGKRMARDGMTEMNDTDATNFALEWQVRDTEPMLFKESRFPQYPRTCTPPTKNLSKRLGVSNFEKEAQQACAHWKQDMEDCIFDVIATRDIMVAEEGHIGASVA